MRQLLLLILLIGCGYQLCGASLISASKVTKCIKDGSANPTSSSGEDCKQKFVVTMAVKSSGLGVRVLRKYCILFINFLRTLPLFLLPQPRNLSAMPLYVSSVALEVLITSFFQAPEYIEAELSSTTTDNGETKTLLNPIKISLLKRGAFLIYPIYYVQVLILLPCSPLLILSHRL
jgi:hypothetical protein